MERVVIERPLSDFSEKSTYFKRLCGIDLDNVPEKYGDSVSDAEALLNSECVIRCVYGRFAIVGISDGFVKLENGVSFTGEMPARVLADAGELFVFVISLSGYDGIDCDGDIMVEYFVDCLGSAYVESAQVALGKQLGELVEGEGLKRTHLWCPGQHGFELSNQCAVFELLDPSEIGCTLTDSMLMLPVKSSSGIFGIVSADKINSLRPCDFCRFKPTCPGSDKGCASI